MHPFFSAIKTWPSRLWKRKWLSLFVLILIGSAAYWAYGKYGKAPEPSMYVLGKVEKGNLTVTLTGTGQVSSSASFDVKPTTSGAVTKIYVKEGQEVKAGALLAQLDSRDAQKSVRDAKVSLDMAKISLEKLRQPTSAQTLLQTQNALSSAQSALEKLRATQPTNMVEAQQTEIDAVADLEKSREDALSATANTFVDLPTMLSELKEIVSGSTISQAEPAIGPFTNLDALTNSVAITVRETFSPLADTARRDLNTADASVEVALAKYQSTPANTDTATLLTLMDSALTATRNLSLAAKSVNGAFATWTNLREERQQVVFATATTLREDSGNLISQANSLVSSLLSAQRSLDAQQRAVTNATTAIAKLQLEQPLDLAAAEALVKERKANLDELNAGTDKLDLASQELTVKQRQNALLDAQLELAKYSVRAPIDGTVTKVPLRVADPASSGTTVVTVAAHQKIADISLNEVDVAKITAGQKVALTFDAIEGLTIDGSVALVDFSGTVTQGVVSYNVKVAFNTEDDRVRAGMTAGASIATEVHENVLIAPTSAIKAQGRNSCIDIPSADAPDSRGPVLLATAPTCQQVQIGATNGTQTVIVSGLNDGDRIVIRTIAGTTTTGVTPPSAAATTPRIPGVTGGGGGGNFTGGAAGRALR